MPALHCHSYNLRTVIKQLWSLYTISFVTTTVQPDSIHGTGIGSKSEGRKSSEVNRLLAFM